MFGQNDTNQMLYWIAYDATGEASDAKASAAEWEAYAKRLERENRGLKRDYNQLVYDNQLLSCQKASKQAVLEELKRHARGEVSVDQLRQVVGAYRDGKPMTRLQKVGRDAAVTEAKRLGFTDYTRYFC